MSKVEKTLATNDEKILSFLIGSQHIEPGAPIQWLSLALRDFLRNPMQSLVAGGVMALFGGGIYLTIHLSDWHMKIMPSIVCFLIICPVLATGLYDISRQHKRRRNASFWHCLWVLNRNAAQEWVFVFVLVCLMGAWLKLTSTIQQMYPIDLEPSLENMLPLMMLDTVVGIGMLMVTFSLSLFTQPILMERRGNVLTAMLSSMLALWRNKAPMAVWALIILTFTGIGFVSYFVAFIILMPLLGFATWHGYKMTLES